MLKMAGANHPSREQLILLNEELRRRADLQWEEMDGLERKAAAILAGTGVVLALAVNNAEGVQGSLEPRCLFVVALISLMVALAGGVAVLWPRPIATVPSPQRLLEYRSREHDETLDTFVLTRAHAVEGNDQKVAAKAHALRVQMVFFGIAAACLVLASVASPLSRTW